MSYNNEQMEAFLIEAELIHQKVKDLAENKLSPQQFDRLQLLRAEDKRKRQQFQKRKETQVVQRKILGRDGKGISKDFKNFCRFCQRQYEFQTPTCFKCQRKTMSLQQRQTQLQVMVADYKAKKVSRQERKHKWDMWQKTKASVWKNNSNNYSKWDYFVSDSQQQVQQEPIVPKNDPNFKALQMDIEERKKRREKDTNQTKKLKQKGNKLMKQGNYQQAMHKYTLALQHAKDVKSVYTNRALAFIKLKKFSKAVKDCTNVIEFMEVFEKVGQNKDLTFKAYSRRALAKKQLKNYQQALDDISQALKLIPNDNNAILLKKEIQGFLVHSKKVQQLLRKDIIEIKTQLSQNKKEVEDNENTQNFQQEIDQDLSSKDKMDANDQQRINSDDEVDQIDKQIVKQIAQKEIQIQKQKDLNLNQDIKVNEINKKQEIKEIQKKATSFVGKQTNKKSPIQQIKQGIKNLNSESIKSIFDLLVKDKNLVDIFIAAKGIQACLNSLIKAETSSKQALLISLCLQGTGVAQKCVWDWGIDRLLQRITLLLSDQTKLKHNVCQIIEDLVQILISISLYEPHRLKLSNEEKVFYFIQKTYSKLMFKSRIKSKSQLLSLFIIFMSNLLSGNDSGLKSKFFRQDKFLTLINSLYVMILDQKSSSNRNFLDLKKNVYGLIANLVTNLEHRKAFIDFAFKNLKFQQLSLELQQYPRSMQNFVPYTQAILSILVNLTLDTNLTLPTLQDILFDRYVSNSNIFTKEIVYRSLLILSRLKYDDLNLQQGRKRLKVFQNFAKNQNPLKNVQEKNNMIQIVRILNAFYTPSQKAKQKVQLGLPIDLFKSLTSYINDNLVHENLFCNTANLFGVIVLSENPSKNLIFQVVSQSMKRLVFIAKQKTGNWRKNSAILIAKCSSNQQVKKSMQKQHAMDVLKSIAHLITQKK